MRVLFALVLSVALLAACGGDDDDDAAAAGDFCEIWPSLNADQQDITDDPTPAQIAEARAVLRRANEAAPDEIGKEVDQLVDVIGGVLDDLEDGKELDPEALFGEVFGVALSAGPKIESWLVDNCPGYEPESGFDDSSSGGDTSAIDTGALGIPERDLDALRSSLLDDDIGSSSTSSGDEYEWTWYFEREVDDAIAICESAAETLAADEHASGTLKLTLARQDETAIVVNEAITPGDPGTCEAA